MVLIMNRCRKCNVNILDDSIICPLCKSVLELSDDMDKDKRTNLGMYQSKSISYPDVIKKRKVIRFVIRLSIFLSILIEALLILINVLGESDKAWSLVTGAIFVYICFTIIYSFQRNVSHRAKLALQMLAAIPLILIIDYTYGANGWSINYGIPIIVLVLELVVFILSMVNFRNCQLYLMVSLLGIIVSLVCAVVVVLGDFKFELLAIIAAAVSIFVFALIVFLGDKKSTSELAKRFRI